MGNTREVEKKKETTKKKIERTKIINS